MPGAGYLPVGERKLPGGRTSTRRSSSSGMGLCSPTRRGPTRHCADFRRAVEAYAAEINGSRSSSPIYARALQLPADFFDGAMREPLALAHDPLSPGG